MPFPVDNIRRGCKAKGITLAELERKLKSGNGVIRRWENAKTSPPIDRLIEISDILEIPLDELCKNNNPMGTVIRISNDDLTLEEKTVIDYFRRATPEQRQALAIFLKANGSAGADPGDPSTGE